MRCFFSMLLLVITCACYGQKTTYSKQLSFKTDNDAYLLQKKDGYYTNGLFVTLSTASEKNNHKIITSYELGQMIFTPRNVNFLRDGGIDRPFCGYLYLLYNKAVFLPKQQIIEWAASIGTVGANSLGENVQETIHKLFKYKKFVGWDTQISNEVGLNTTLKYAKALSTINTPLLKIIPQSELTLGTTFTNAKIGGYICFGLMREASNSSLFNASISKNTMAKTKAECFIYWHPQLIYQLYNATVQGGLFTDNGHDVTAPVFATMYMQTFGLRVASGRIASKLEVAYQTQEARTQQQSQRYASISIGYQFH
ncbi:MAG: lipid A deacylase LpxR family protein [Deinococcales bacterium]|nr:lipid A deacylase LpxR family protein [Chitinophagaceae bacterium]